MVRSGGTDPQHTSAFIAGVASFATWGLVPIYWKLLTKVPAREILAHRFVWTIVFLGLLLSWQKRWREVIGNIRSRRRAVFCLGSGVMVGLNWLLFIWAVNIGHVLETSLGYFMTPIVNVLLGAVILRERLSAWQTASILIALVAVSILAFGYGHFPWIALGLCTSFGLYGLLSFLGFLFITRHSPASISLPFFSFGSRLSLFQPKRLCAGARPNGWPPQHHQIPR
jgi:chloramphenicol-sensitive protein RarD